MAKVPRTCPVTADETTQQSIAHTETTSESPRVAIDARWRGPRGHGTWRIDVLFSYQDWNGHLADRVFT